ncbi:MAG: type II toxin-antitoxin system mRNA interferase toxin, RelE/StbE family [Chloroflexi bacterium]|nr:MAG: type II toxin-antitoxin system mRNA interferase toxin, RelE/StbE family [Chloroflexota bacterium]
MTKYRLDLGENRRIIARLPGNIRQRVKRALIALADDPRPEEARALDGELAGYYRLRIDRYRMIYTIREEFVTVVIVRVIQRNNETYKGLPIID